VITGADVDRAALTRRRLLGSGRGRLGFVQIPVVRVVGRRILQAIPLLFVVSALSFVLVSLSPGDPAKTLLGSEAGPAAYKRVDHELGLDRPLYDQYWRWVSRAVQGDLGRSLFNNEPVTTKIKERFPVTLSIVVLALLTQAILGIGFGVYSAVRGGVSGRFVDGLSLFAAAIPGFWLGVALVAAFSVKLGWFPAIGYTPLSASPTQWILGLVLPVFALSIQSLASIAKLTREAMLDVLASEHIRMAWANGVTARKIFFKYSLKNAAMVSVTILGLHAVYLLGGTVFIENVFALPGLGTLLVDSTIQHDLPVVQGITMFLTIMIVAVNLMVDLAYSWLDPRVRTS
jgi:peptide/nickel transport system permease protein